MLLRTPGIPSVVLVDPSTLLPRFWASVWASSLATQSLRPGTVKAQLRHIDALYSLCDARYGQGALDRALGAANLESVSAMVTDFYHSLADEEGQRGATARWEVAQARQSRALSEAEVRRTSDLLVVCQRAVSEQNATNGALREELRLAEAELSALRSEVAVASQSRVLIDSELQVTKARIMSVERELISGRDEHIAMRRELDESRLRIASLDAERTSLQERFTEVRQALGKSEENVQQLFAKLFDSQESRGRSK